MTKNPDGTVTLTAKEFEDLQEDAAFLNDLCIAGVDNWEGYEEACDARVERDTEKGAQDGRE